MISTYIPTEKTLRLGYDNEIFDKIINKIKLHFLGNKIWVSIDEMTDIGGRFVAYMVVRILKINRPGEHC